MVSLPALLLTAPPCSIQSLLPKLFPLPANKNRCQPKRLQCVATAQTSVDVDDSGRSGNYQPSIWHYDFIQSLQSDYKNDKPYADRVAGLKQEAQRLLQVEEPPFACPACNGFDHNADHCMGKPASSSESSGKDNLKEWELVGSRNHGVGSPKEFPGMEKSPDQNSQAGLNSKKKIEQGKELIGQNEDVRARNCFAVLQQDVTASLEDEQLIITGFEENHADMSGMDCQTQTFSSKLGFENLKDVPFVPESESSDSEDEELEELNGMEVATHSYKGDGLAAGSCQQELLVQIEESGVKNTPVVARKEGVFSIPPGFTPPREDIGLYEGPVQIQPIKDSGRKETLDRDIVNEESELEIPPGFTPPAKMGS